MEVTIGMDKGFSARYKNAAQCLEWMADHGVTSIETYVLWQDIEPVEGAWDFSRFDDDVDLMRQYGIRWVPFLIAGPWYSTPTWFLQSQDSLVAQCLEHGLDTGTQSIWNPRLWPRIESFLAAFRRHYAPGDLESVLLGVTGDYGEAIFPVHGNWPGEYHGHGGYWCGDTEAVTAFQLAVERRHGTIAGLNHAWGSHYHGWWEVRPFLRSEAPSQTAWLELVDWYRESMTAWSARWMDATRRYWPETEIYLCTGGDMIPSHGSDFVRQAKVAARFGGGLRITNEGSDFLHNLLLTRLVTVGTQYYGGFSGIEPAARVTPEGVAIRMFNATGSGARQLHEYFGNLFDHGDDGAARPRPDASEVWQRNRVVLQRRIPTYRVALAFSNTELALTERGIADGEIHRVAESLRALTDFAVVDETLIAEGVLSRLGISVVVLANSGPWAKKSVRALQGFVADGGLTLASGIPRVLDGAEEPWLTEWTGETRETVEWKGITGVESTGWEQGWTSLGQLAVSSSVSGLADVAEVLLRTRYKPTTERDLAVLWRVRYGKGASYFYTGPFAVDPRSWMQETSMLAELFRYLSAGGHFDAALLEPDESMRTVFTDSGRLSLRLGSERPTVAYGT